MIEQGKQTMHDQTPSDDEVLRAMNLRVKETESASNLFRLEDEHRASRLQRERYQSVGGVGLDAGPAIEVAEEISEGVGRLKLNHARKKSKRHYEKHEGVIQQEALEEALREGKDIKGW